MPEPEVTATSTSEPAPQESFEDRALKFVEAQLQQATGTAEEVPSVEAASTTEAEVPAAEVKTETPAVETKTETPAEPFTEEQLRDPAFFDKLDKPGWKALEDWNPALYRKAKAVYSALGKANQQASQSKATPPAEERSEPAKPKVSDAMRAALKKANSLDEDEAFEGQQEVARLTLVEQQERQRQERSAIAEETQTMLSNAHEIAVAELPDLAKLDDDALDAEVKESPKLMRALNAAVKHPDREERALLVADVMVDAGRAVLAKRQAAADAKAKAEGDTKKAADQARLRSNEKNPSTAIVETPSGKVPGGKKTFETDGLDFINSQLTAAAPVR